MRERTEEIEEARPPKRGVEPRDGRAGVSALTSAVGNRAFAEIARTRARPAGPVIQRYVTLEMQNVPSLATQVFVHDITRPGGPGSSEMAAESASGADAGRHVISWAALKREFQARFSRKTVGDLKNVFPSVALDENYAHNLAAAMWNVVLWESNQLNRGGATTAAPEGATPDSSRVALPAHGSAPGQAHKSSRNYWLGPAAGNTLKEQASDKWRQQVDQIWYAKFGKKKDWLDPAVVAQIPKTDLLAYQQAAASSNLAWMAEEFDPPPHASKADMQTQATEWARITNSYLRQNSMNHAFYWPARDVQWQDAFQSSAGNQAVYNSAK